MCELFFSSFVTGNENQYFLVDVVFMDRCNYSTVSQAILASIHSNCLDLNDALAVVTDNAAYCLEAYREVLKGVMQCPCYLPLPYHQSGGWDLAALQIFLWCCLTCDMDDICLLQEAHQTLKMGGLPHQWGVCAGQGSSWGSVYQMQQLVWGCQVSCSVCSPVQTVFVGRGGNRHGSQEHPQPLGIIGEEAEPHSKANFLLRRLLQTDDPPDHPGRNPQNNSSVCTQCHGGSWLLPS